MSGYFLLLSCFEEISEFNANRVDPKGTLASSVDQDQTQQNAASDMGLHCLPMSLLWDARHKWLKGYWIYLADRRQLY